MAPKPKPVLIYTPQAHIPLGEPFLTEDGTRAVRFKKPGSKVTEEVTLDTLISMYIHATDKCNQAGSPSEAIRCK